MGFVACDRATYDAPHRFRGHQRLAKRSRSEVNGDGGKRFLAVLARLEAKWSRASPCTLAEAGMRSLCRRSILTGRTGGTSGPGRGRLVDRPGKPEHRCATARRTVQWIPSPCAMVHGEAGPLPLRDSLFGAAPRNPA